MLPDGATQQAIQVKFSSTIVWLRSLTSFQAERTVVDLVNERNRGWNRGQSRKGLRPITVGSKDRHDRASEDRVTSHTKKNPQKTCKDSLNAWIGNSYGTALIPHAILQNTEQENKRLTNDDFIFLGKRVCRNLQIEGSRSFSCTSGDVVVRAMAGAEPSSEVASLTDRDTSQVGTDT